MTIGLVVVLVVLAGCGGGSSNGTQTAVDGQPTETDLTTDTGPPTETEAGETAMTVVETTTATSAMTTTGAESTTAANMTSQLPTTEVVGLSVDSRFSRCAIAGEFGRLE